LQIGYEGWYVGVAHSSVVAALEPLSFRQELIEMSTPSRWILAVTAESNGCLMQLKRKACAKAGRRFVLLAPAVFWVASFRQLAPGLRGEFAGAGE
jgi:hypothetical protein